MAERRRCSSCGRVWYHSDTANVWVCEACGAEIPMTARDGGAAC